MTQTLQEILRAPQVFDNIIEITQSRFEAIQKYLDKDELRGRADRENLGKSRENCLRNSLLWAKYPGCQSFTQFYPSEPFSGGPKWISEVVVNSDGSLPIYNYSTHKVLTEEDLLRGFAIVGLHYPASVQEQIDKEASELDKVKKVIAKYKAGKKPSIEELLHGGSVSEPVLQVGTVVEGLTWQFVSSALLIRANIEDDINSPFKGLFEGDSKESSFRLLYGNYSLMKNGRALLNKYLTFISDILIKDPTIRPKDCFYRLSKEGIQRYIDLEWQNKEEAINLAQEIEQLYEQRNCWLKSDKTRIYNSFFEEVK